MSVVIKVENLSKQYRLGDVGTGTLSHDLKRWWYKARGKEDPYLQIGEINDRSTKGESDYVWALKDINFEVKAGEVLGIIGRNGAGKSTLLKILSKTTAPTTGKVKVKGRIASLLEVGTGFHPELSGRENIFLNGAILGMTKQEIKSKFDEIVDFSGVERYIDTPVKRYSSGMYVRLAFAVAAHLEPEILIVDEVLAVGDAEFQKKCLGKMKDVSVNEGRTVLFVSHNMAAVQGLCSYGLVLSNGGVIYPKGNAYEAIELYRKSIIPKNNSNKDFKNANRTGNRVAQLESITFLNALNEEISTINCGENISIEFQISSKVSVTGASLGIGFYSLTGECKLLLWSTFLNVYFDFISGVNRVKCYIEKFPLTQGEYSINLILTSNEEVLDWIQDSILINVNTGDYYNSGKMLESNHQTAMIPHEWIKI